MAHRQCRSASIRLQAADRQLRPARRLEGPPAAVPSDGLPRQPAPVAFVGRGAAGAPGKQAGNR